MRPTVIFQDQRETRQVSGQKGWVVGELCERKTKKMRKALELEAWEKGRSQHELQARVWVMKRMAETGTTLRSVLDKLRLWGVDRMGHRPSNKNIRGIPSQPRDGVKM